MNLWETREEAIKHLENRRNDINMIINEIFAIIDDCIDRYNKKWVENKNSADGIFYQYCGYVLVKAKNLSLGTYSLFLDGLGQEAGALGRVLIEQFELLEYFKINPEKTQIAKKGKLPSAGKIAQEINGKFKDLRDFFNTHACHSSFSNDSIGHLIDSTNSDLKKTQPFNSDVLEVNLFHLYWPLDLIATSAIDILIEKNANYDESLAIRMNECRKMRGNVFNNIYRSPVIACNSL